MIKIIEEKMIVKNGKLIYGIRLNQNDSKLDMYIDNHKLYFEDDSYMFRNSNKQFDFNDETHCIAKEIFLSELKNEVKIKLLDIKQMQYVLDELGLKNILKETVEKNNPIINLVEQTKNILVEQTKNILVEKTRKNKKIECKEKK